VANAKKGHGQPQKVVRTIKDRIPCHLILIYVAASDNKHQLATLDVMRRAFRRWNIEPVILNHFMF
jgi:hypothetical protein